MTTRRTNAIGFGLVAAALAICSLADAATPPTAKTAQGRVEGVRVGAVVAYRGIPYAAPPVGANRWLAPQAPSAWQGVRAAHDFGASCYQGYPAGQFGPYTSEFVDLPPVSEDCLFLNVWTAANAGERAPVFVWIHGGAFLGGAGAVPIYGGANLAAKGVVVVTINYRVGPFGFLAHAALSAENAEKRSGNYGLLDQIAALRWIRRNIANFGGDPRNVTIAGQSAGSASVNDLLVSPEAAGLFQRAAAQSGSGMGVQAAPLNKAESDGLEFAAYLGAKTAAELRALPAQRIQSAVYLPLAPVSAAKAPPPVRFAPVLDGRVLPVDPDNPRGAVASRVPLLTGFTADERLSASVRTVADLEKEVTARFGAHADRILAVYPHGTDAEAVESSSQLARDSYMTSLVLWTRARTESSGQAIYAYRFDHAIPVKTPPSYGAFHTAEVPYLFGVLDTNLRPYDAVDRHVADEVQGYWLNFMKTGDPNGAGLASWSRATGDSTTVLAIEAESAMKTAVSTPERFDALRSYVADGGELGLF